MNKEIIKAVIFDLDGTILDSEPTYFISEKDFLSNYGIVYDNKMKELFTGRGAEDMFRVLEEMFPGNSLHNIPMAERLKLKDENYLSIAPKLVKPFPETCRFAKMLKQKNIPIALATGSSHTIVDCLFVKNNMTELFPIIVSATDVKHSKPAPDIFLLAAEKIGVNCSECLVVEDSKNGVLAAKNAGMKCIALPEDLFKDTNVFNKAELVVPGGAACFNADLAFKKFNFGCK